MLFLWIWPFAMHEMGFQCISSRKIRQDAAHIITADRRICLDTPLPKSHRQPARPGAEAVLLAAAQAFGVKAEAVQSRSHQPAFRAWVYLLRRATNLSLREAGERAGVSPGRISQIQRVAEAEKPAPELARLMRQYKVKA